VGDGDSATAGKGREAARPASVPPVSLLVAAIGYGLVTASLLAIAAVGFTLQFSVTNVLNLAYGDVMTLCAFVAYGVNVTLGLNIWLGLVAGAIAGAVLTTLINRGLYAPFTRRGTNLFAMVMVTLSVGLLIRFTLQVVVGTGFFNYRLNQGAALHFLGMTFAPSNLGIMAVAVAGMLAVHSLLRYTKLGKAMRAVAADANMAKSCGIRSDRIIDIALAMNTATFAVGTGNSFLVIIIAAAVLGGVGQPYGAMVGALVIGVGAELAATIISPDLKDVFAFLTLVVILLVRPGGIFSGVASQREVVVT
jgi:branched-subunit amino acid ABC-type transport system permease component